MNILAERIKELRIDRGLSQRDLAKAIGCTQPAVARWESNLQIPNAVIIKNIAVYFGVSSDYLLGLED